MDIWQTYASGSRWREDVGAGIDSITLQIVDWELQCFTFTGRNMALSGVFFFCPVLFGTTASFPTLTRQTSKKPNKSHLISCLLSEHFSPHFLYGWFPLDISRSPVFVVLTTTCAQQTCCRLRSAVNNRSYVLYLLFVCKVPQSLIAIRH